MELAPTVAADVVVTVSGGVVTGVFSKHRQLHIAVIDWDDIGEDDTAQHVVEHFPHEPLKSMPQELRELMRCGR